MFRAWDKVKREMHTNPFNGKICGLNDIFQDSGNWVFMQFSGLDDEEGTKIFEGDIVYCQHNVSETPYTQEVLFRCGGFCIGGRDFICNLYKVKIIGNIYQNPEMLRGDYK